jgi:hypothetical protein
MLTGGDRVFVVEGRLWRLAVVFCPSAAGEGQARSEEGSKPEGNKLGPHCGVLTGVKRGSGGTPKSDWRWGYSGSRTCQKGAWG